MRIIPNETIALIIDYQEKLVPVMSVKEQLIENTSKLVKGLNILNIPTLYSQQYTKGLGMTIPELVETTEGDFTYFDKTSFSCVEDPAIIKAIESSNCKSIIVCGIESHICVLQTVIDLLAKNYQVYLVTDCISSRKENDTHIAMKRATSEGALLTTCESLLFELTASAKSESFRAISQLIK